MVAPVMVSAGYRVCVYVRVYGGRSLPRRVEAGDVTTRGRLDVTIIPNGGCINAEYHQLSHRGAARGSKT